MQDNNYTTAQMHDTIDLNKDGHVDKKEFVTGFSGMQIPGLMQKHLVSVFEAIDIDNNCYLSLNEFSLYLEGVHKKREQRINELPADITQDIKN